MLKLTVIFLGSAIAAAGLDKLIRKEKSMISLGYHACTKKPTSSAQ